MQKTERSIRSRFEHSSAALLARQQKIRSRKRRTKAEAALRKQKFSRTDQQQAAKEVKRSQLPRPLSAAIRAEATFDVQKSRYINLCLFFFQQFEELLKKETAAVQRTFPMMTPDWRLLCACLVSMGMSRADNGSTTVLSVADADTAKVALAVPHGPVWGRRVVMSQHHQHPHTAASALLPAAAGQYCADAAAVMQQTELQQRESILDAMIDRDIRDWSPDLRSVTTVDLRSHPATITAVVAEIQTNVTLTFYRTGLKRTNW